MGHAVAIAVELDAEILMHEQLNNVAVIVRNDRQRLQGGRLKAIYGSLAGLAVLALVGDFGEPLAGLAIDIMQIGELAQWPEALACIADGPLHFTFFPARRWITGTRVEPIFPRETEEAGKKTHQATIVLRYSGGEVVIDDLSGDTTQGNESVHMAADKSLKALL